MQDLNNSSANVSMVIKIFHEAIRKPAGIHLVFNDDPSCFIHHRSEACNIQVSAMVEFMVKG